MLAIAVFQEKEAKGILTGNREIKLFLLANNMIPYTEKSEDFSKNFVRAQANSECCRVQNKQTKSLALYTKNNFLTKKSIRQSHS